MVLTTRCSFRQHVHPKHLELVINEYPGLECFMCTIPIVRPFRIHICICIYNRLELPCYLLTKSTQHVTTYVLASIDTPPRICSTLWNSGIGEFITISRYSNKKCLLWNYGWKSVNDLLMCQRFANIYAKLQNQKYLSLKLTTNKNLVLFLFWLPGGRYDF